MWQDFFMNDTEYLVYKLMTTIELAFQFSGLPANSKNAFIKRKILKMNADGQIDKKAHKYLLTRVKYKEPAAAYLWDMFYEQFSRSFAVCQALSSLNDTERLKKLFDEMESSGYCTIFGINEEFSPSSEQSEMILSKGLLAIHESQIQRIEDGGNFPDEKFIVLTAYGNQEQFSQIMAKLQKYGFGCIPDAHNGADASFIKVRSSAKHCLTEKSPI
jgi:hypothetical protein